jgi:two-component SAPR family response regulator
VHEFDQLLADAAAESDPSRRIVLRRNAMERYTGELLPEDGSADHVVGERERLRFAAATTSCAIARDHISAGQFTEATAAARRSLELDRYQDSAWQLLVDALSASGDQSAALRAQQEHLHVRAELEDDAVVETPYSTSRAAVERSLSAR